MSSILLSILLFCLLRVYLTANHAQARIDEVFMYNMDLVDTNSYWSSKMEYDANNEWLIKMIDIRKWTYLQYYPKRAGEK